MENPIDIKAVFKAALDQTVSRYAEKARLEIAEFILHISGEVRPYVVVTDAGASMFADEIFTSELKRDFVFNLLFNFCPRLSFDNNVTIEFNKLINSMAFALSIGDHTTSKNLAKSDNVLNKLPEELIVRLQDSAEIIILLENNKWLLMILLISLYITVDDFKLTEDVKKKKT